MPKVSALQSTPALASGDLVYVVADGVSSKLASLRVATIAAMTAIAAPTNGMSVEVTDLTRGGLFVFDTSATAAGNGGTKFSADDSTVGSWVRSATFALPSTVSVPGDYATIQDALDAIAAHGANLLTGVTINITTGHALTRGITVKSGDFSMVRITSTDATVSLAASPGFTGADTTGVPALVLGETGPDSTTLKPFMLVAMGATGPTLDCLIDMGGLYGSGIQVAEGSVVVAPGGGVINAGFRGIQVHGRANIYNAVFNGAKGAGIRLQQASSVNARGASANNCCSTTDSTTAAVYVSRGSSLEFRGGSATGSGAAALMARRSVVSADDAVLNNATGIGLSAELNSIVSASGVSATGTGSHSIYSRFGANVYAGGAILSTSGSAKELRVDEGGTIQVNSSTSVDALTGEANILAATQGATAGLGAMGDGGLIFYRDGNGAFKITGSAGSQSQRTADGRMTCWVTATIDISVATGVFSSRITLPALPDTFLSIDHVNISAVGRTAVSGGGNRIAVDIYHRCTGSGDEVRLFNHGVQLDGDGTALAIESVFIQMLVAGRWR